jgi:hypothetical protein
VEETPTKALVSTILQHAEDYPWRMQDVGLLGLRLDERREFGSMLGSDFQHRGGRSTDP